MAEAVLDPSPEIVVSIPAFTLVFRGTVCLKTADVLGKKLHKVHHKEVGIGAELGAEVGEGFSARPSRQE